MPTTQELSRMGRRRFLSSLAGLGVSGVGLNLMTQDALAELTANPEEEVPRLGYLSHTNHDEVEAGTAPPKHEPIYYTISRDKWSVVETAHNAASKVDTFLKSKFSSVNLSTGVVTITRGHHRRKAVHVDYVIRRDATDEIISKPPVSVKTVRDSLPETISGVAGEGKFQTTIEDIPIVVEQREFSESGTSGGAYNNFNYDYKYRPVPGGACYYNEGKGGLCTTTTPAYDNEQSAYSMVTAGHCMTSSGQNIHQPDTNNKIGETTNEFLDRDNETFDGGVISLAEDHTYKFANNNGDNDYAVTPIYGTMSWSTIKDNEGDSNYSMQYRGSKSGLIHTYIEKANSNDQYFWLEDDSQGGDSGGPMYHVEFDGYDGRAYIGGVLEGSYYSPADGDIDCGGTYIGKVEDRYSLSV